MSEEHSSRRRLSGAQTLDDHLIRRGRSADARPGHGGSTVVPALPDRRGIRIPQPMRERSGAHLADRVDRESERPMLAVIGSGPGRTSARIPRRTHAGPGDAGGRGTPIREDHTEQRAADVAGRAEEQYP